MPAGDEPHYLVITQSLMRDGDLQIENNHTRGDYLVVLPERVATRLPAARRQPADLLDPRARAVGRGHPGVRRRRISGRRRVPHPVWRAGLGAVVVARLPRDPRRAAAWAGWAVVATSITFIVHTFTVYPDGLSGRLRRLSALWALFLRADAPAWRFGRSSVRPAALLPWLHTRNAPVALVIGLAVAWPLLRQRAMAGARGAGSCRCRSARSRGSRSSRSIYGVFDPVGALRRLHAERLREHPSRDRRAAVRSAVRAAGLRAGPRDRLRGDRDDGVATTHAGMATCATPTNRHAVSPLTLALVLLAVVVPYSVLSASYTMWWGGASAPARFLTPVVLPLRDPGGRHVASLPVTRRARRDARTDRDVGRRARRLADAAARAAWRSTGATASPCWPTGHRRSVISRRPCRPCIAIRSTSPSWRALAWMAVPIACLAVGWALTRRDVRVARRRRARDDPDGGGWRSCLAARRRRGRWRGVSGHAAPTRRRCACSTRCRARLPVRSPVVFRDAPRNDGFGRTERTTKRCHARRPRDAPVVLDDVPAIRRATRRSARACFRRGATASG